jgi:hypothetical protein
VHRQGPNEGGKENGGNGNGPGGDGEAEIGVGRVEVGEIGRVAVVGEEDAADDLVGHQAAQYLHPHRCRLRSASIRVRGERALLEILCAC